MTFIEQQLAKLDKVCREADITIEPIINKTVEIKKPKIETPKGNLFNIHKRSLPIGNPPMDEVVSFNLTKKEAEFILNHVSVENRVPLLKPKCYEDDTDNSKTIIFYDMIPVNATPKERSIFYNPGPITKED